MTQVGQVSRPAQSVTPAGDDLKPRHGLGPVSKSTGARILVVEDELPMRVALADILASESYRVSTAANGETGLDHAINGKPDLILLDIMLPKLDGFAILRRTAPPGDLDAGADVTAKGQVEDRVTGLDSGADDYLVKPFSTEELLARVRALLRRIAARRRAVATLTLGRVEIDLVRLTARRGREPIHLTAKEFAVLRLLAEAAGEPVTRERFLDLVWGHDAFPTTRTVDNHIASLRAKLEPNPETPRWIQTVHGVGYRLEMEGKETQL